MFANNDEDYICDLDSDDGKAESSEDEIQQFLHGTPEQKRRIRRRSLGQNSSSDDEFEKEMDAELNQQIKSMSTSVCQITEASDTKKKSTTKKDDKNTDEEFYDDMYFDSDEEDKSNRRRKTDDELLYDPDDDDANQKWVDDRRRARMGHGKKKLPNSDAVLDCPACMTTLCYDCQRHDVYKNQYRAMFVENCHVNTQEVLRFAESLKKGGRRKGGHQRLEPVESQAANATEGDIFHPVRCEVCTTEVGVIDTDEVIHFFNVLASHT